jgi:hypothetical protein
MIGIAYQTSEERERNYIGNIIELAMETGNKVRGLLDKINARHLGIKVGNRWYSIKRFNPKVEVDFRDALTEEPYMVGGYQNV